MKGEIQTAMLNLRTSKIQLLPLLDERTPVDQLDVTGKFDWSGAVLPLSDYHQIALASRPDLRGRHRVHSTG
jgi:outer membrane protein, heavy metal efflux system